MAKYQAYAEYKDSGVEFLPILPSTWKVRRVKSILDLQRTILGEKSKYYQLLSLTLRGVILRDVSGGDGKIPESFDTYQAVKKKDLVFCLFDMDETPRTVGISEHDGMITGAYNVYKVNKSSFPKFIYYYFLHLDYFKGLKPFYTGLRKVVRSDTFANIKMPCPPLAEQTQIANFLDHETAKIDHLIEKQQQLIELLKEKRQAVISHAVTKGLNPNVPMKDSGVEWLGEVPEHWKVTPIKRIILSMEQGKSPECENIPATSDQWGVLKTSCVNNGVFHANQNKALPENIKPHTQYQVKAGDVLMSRASGSINLIGSVALVPENIQDNLLLSDKIFRIHLSKDCDSRFFTLLLATPYMRTLIERAISGAEGMANNITKTAILEFISAVPPLDEQLQLVVYLNQKIETFNSLIQKSSRAIEVMQERRTTLISAAVTGKIDVRNWQAPTVAEAHTELSA